MALKYWLLPAAGAVAMSGVMIAQEVVKNNARTEVKQVSTLPISRVILFSSGAGALSSSERRRVFSPTSWRTWVKPR